MIMESAGENDKEGEGGAVSVRNVLLGGGSGSNDFWDGELGLVRGDGITNTDNGAEVKAAERQDLAKCGSGEGY